MKFSIHTFFIIFLLFFVKNGFSQISDEFDDAVFSQNTWSVLESGNPSFWQTLEYDGVLIEGSAAGGPAGHATLIGDEYFYADNYGSYIFQMANGDFQATAYVRSLDRFNTSQPPNFTFQATGLVVRDPADVSGVWGDHDFIMVNLGRQTNSHTSNPNLFTTNGIASESKTTNNSVSNLCLAPDNNEGEVRMVRTGNIFRTYKRTIGDADFVLLDEFIREDFVQNAQIGPMCSSWDGQGHDIRSEVDYVRFETPDCGAMLPCRDLMITSVFDGGLELYVVNNIADLSDYGLSTYLLPDCNYGEQFSFPSVTATAGDFIYVVSNNAAFTAYMGFAADYETAFVNDLTGSNPVGLFGCGVTIDVFGEVLTNSGTWDYTDGWAYRANETAIQCGNFNPNDWTNSPNSYSTTNAASSDPIPVGTFIPANCAVSETFTNPTDNFINQNQVTETSDFITASNLIDLSGAGTFNVHFQAANEITFLPEFETIVANSSQFEAIIADCATISAKSNEIIKKETPYNLEIFPNPNSGSFFIELKNEIKPNKDFIEIIDNQGRIINRLNNLSPKTEISGLDSGIYWVKCVVNGEVLVKKVGVF